MTLVQMYAEPGICKVNSAYASGKTGSSIKDRTASGRFIDGDHIRFVAGFPEKIGGWVKAIATQMVGVPRVITDWRDQNGNAELAIGTENHLYIFDDGAAIVDITPLRTISTGTLAADPFTTASGSAVVAVADASQVLIDGDWVELTGATAVNGITINGWYSVSGRSGTGYNITAANVASGTGAGGGAAVAFAYPRVTLSNPFATTSGSPIVTVTHNSNGSASGDYVTFSGASAVAGLTINGQYQLTVVNANSYTINAGSNANATTSGGGSVSVIYDVTVGQITGLTPVPYGTGAYGTGPYGYALTSTPASYNGWTVAAYGIDVVACPVGGTIYLYESAIGGRAHPILNAPTSCLAIFVTPERFLFALGISGNAMELAWPDQSDLTNWTSTSSDTANSGRTLQGGTFFVGGGPVANGVSLFFSNRCVFEAAYTGDNEVYNTPLLSDLCGLIGPQAFATLGGVGYWMSDHDFWTWNGTVVPLPSDDIRDYVFTNINTQYQSKCVVGTNRAKKEVWFFYPAGGSTDISNYVIYHIDQGVWSIGTMVRTAWRDSDLFTQPYGCDTSGYLYAHEIGVNADGGALDYSLEFAPIDISTGNLNIDVFGFIPDFERIAEPTVLGVTVQQYPMSTDGASLSSVIQPDGSTPRLDFRLNGKMVGYSLQATAINSDFRLGVPRVNIQQAGARQ